MPRQPSPEFLALQTAIAGRYSLERELGRGGMGIVFLARDVALDRQVAIKLLPPALTIVADMRERFLREARTAARLTHPHIVPIHLVEERDDLVYFVMAYVDGESLGQRIRRHGALPATQVARIMREVAWALAYAHQHGVVHRDIKPDNILLEKGSDRAIVTDFGIARVADADGVPSPGELVGTLHYMSPEQAGGGPVDGRSDLYSLGVTGYQALTGALPFESRNLPALIQAQRHRAPRVARAAPRLPPELAAAVDRCLARAPDGRFASAEDLGAALAAGTPVRKEVPAEIRALLRHLRETGISLSGLAGVVMGAGLLFDDVFAQIWAAESANILWFGLIISVGILSYPLRLLRMTRRVIRMGHSLGDVRGALLDEAEMLSEEQELEGRARALARRGKRERWIRRGPGLILAGAALLPLGGLAGGIELALVGAVALFAGLVFSGAAPAVDPTSPVAALPVTERLLVGRLGRLLFRLAGGGPRPAEARDDAATRHTEAFLASEVDRIFARLPDEVRGRFPTLPAAIERLEQDAQALRERQDALSRAVVAGSPAESDLEAERDRVRRRLEQAVAALESIRLDLLRLYAGAGSPDNLTADLDKAREINEAVGAELAARDEVAKLE